MLDPRMLAQVLVRDDNVSLRLLWAWYRGNGGNAGLMEFEAYLYELTSLDAFDLKILAWALEDNALEWS
ncbi:hypothetical protein [Pseudarthrobacter sp. NS4]|uniref:hypothetical protein n=1 Tax=Pseudarthrobacter sp. NS4 TaxID=2973976 RepID=UPI002161AD9B|nr:hypothetical protein [Pseudarthrobacter sp. NS4]